MYRLQEIEELQVMYVKTAVLRILQKNKLNQNTFICLLWWNYLVLSEI